MSSSFHRITRDEMARIVEGLTSKGREPSQALSAFVPEMLAEAAADGSIPTFKAGDVLRAMDPATAAVGAERWCEIFGIPTRTFFARPRGGNTMALGGTGLAVADFAWLLAVVERIGFRVDPAPLMERLRDGVARSTRLTMGELAVFWFAKERHRMPPLLLGCPGGEGRSTSHTFKTETGYVLTVRHDESGAPVVLEAERPKRTRTRGLRAA